MRKTKTQKQSPNFLLFLLGLLLVMAVLVAAFFPGTVRTLLTGHLSRVTGLPANIRQLDFSLTQPQFLLKDLLLANPAGFPSAELAQIAQVKVQYVPSFAMLGQFNLNRVEVDFKELRLIRNRTGNINLPIRPPLQAVGDTIDEVVINLGTITYTDLSGPTPVQKTFDLGLNKATYRNVKGVAGILEIISWEVFKRTGVETEAKPAPEVQTAEVSAPPEPESKPAEAQAPAEPAATPQEAPA